MDLQVPDRVPVMCQLATGHYYLHAGIDPLEIWFTSAGFVEALIRMQQRYRFDGILINLPGRDPDYSRYIRSIERGDEATVIYWKNDHHTFFPHDNVPHYRRADGTTCYPTFEEIHPDLLYYVEPWNETGITYPNFPGFNDQTRPPEPYFPSYQMDTIRLVREHVDETISIHSEVFSPWSQFLELLGCENGLLAIADDPGKVAACLERLTAGAVDLGKKQANENVDAILVSSAFAGAGIISRQHYREFVLPYEQQLISEIKRNRNVRVYTHTCGSIGDRLDLMLATGTDGIDTLDPPPLGTIDLEEAKDLLAGKAFIKGNLDPVGTLLNGTIETVRQDVIWRLGVGKRDGGYILSSACSVSPHTPPENIEVLITLAEEYGKY